MKILSIIEMEAGKESMDRPLCLNLSCCQPGRFWEHSVRDAERDTCGRWSFERQMKPDNAAAPNVDGEGEPGSLDRRACDAIDDNNIDEGVIDLYESQRPGRLQCADCWRILVASRF
jgi:hypothetical protein